MPGRILERKKRRLPCAINAQAQRFRGIVVDLSASGLFVQTSARARPGEALELEVSVPGQVEPIPLTVQVVRQKCVPPALRSVAQGGIAARVLQACEPFYAYVMSLESAPSSRAA